MVEVSTELPLLTPEGLTPQLNPIPVVDGSGLDRLESFLRGLPAKENAPTIDIDYETNMADTFWDRKPRLLAIGNKDEQHIIDFRAFAPSTEAMVQMGKYKSPVWAEPILRVIRPVLESNAFLKVGQNLGFEYEVSSWNLGIKPWNLYSIDIAERVIWAGLHTFKDLKFYSLDAMTRRYFKKRVDKTLQTSFDLERPITFEDQIYSCLDLRLPRAIRQMQLRTLIEDNLYRVTKIENDAIGAFVDMHLAGMRIDRAAWAALIAEWSVRYRNALEQLDTHMLPVVGRKNVPEGDLDVLFAAWKDRTVESSDELELKAQKRATKDAAEKARIEGQRKFLETTRKAAAAEARQQWQTLKTRQRVAREMMDDCVGEAAINYGSNKQIRAALLKMKGFTEANLPNTEDDVLKKHRTKPVIISMRDMRKYEKLIQTYGESWIRPWSTKPSNEEGWLCPHDEKIHSVIHQLEAETGRTSSVKPNCFSDDTELLTEDGWVLFSALEEGAKVAEFDTSDSSIRFSYPVSYIKNRHNGTLKHIHTQQQVDLLVTGDHDCLIQSRKTCEWKKVKARDYPEDVRQYNAGVFVGGDVDSSNDRLTVICALQADGHIISSGAVSWVFTKQRKIERLEKALENCGVNFSKRPKGGSTRITILSRDVPVWLLDKKVWGKWVLSLNRKSLSFLAEEVWFWDGAHKRRSMYSSSIKSNADWVQIITALSGRRARVREYWNGNPKSVTNYQVDASSNDYSLTTNVKIDDVPYDGYVYCVEMPLGTVIVRRNNVVSVTGNCQNLPHDPRVRACFIADPPDESIRVSVCHDSDTSLEVGTGQYWCDSCGNPCDTKPEEFVIVTTDMSGAELRIIAEDSGAPTWVEAFQKGWDVHSVGAELLYPELWPGLAAKDGDVDAGGDPLPACAYYNKDHKKCKCPGHLDLRDGNKSTNFLLAYGGGPPALAEAIDKTEAEAESLMGLHRQKNPEVWAYLDGQGRKAVQNLEARDRAGRRRKFQEPNWDKAKERARERLFERLKKKNGGKNTDGTKFTIDQCNPTNEQIKSALRGLWGSIERMGKNMPIQGLNATIAKLVMGCGFDKNGKGYLWHVLPKYNARLINMVHDEFVVHCPKRYAKRVEAEVKDCIKRAAAEFMSVIVMESEARIKPYWCK